MRPGSRHGGATTRCACSPPGTSLRCTTPPIPGPPPSWPAARPPTAPRRWRSWAATAPSTRWSTGWRARPCRSGWSAAARPTCSPARSACPTTPSRPPPGCSSCSRAANGDPFTYLGPRPFRPTPLARFEDGMDVLVGQSMATMALARALTAMLSSRPRSAAIPGFPVVHDLRRFTLEADVPLAFQLDGEYLGDHTSLLFEHLPDALAVIAPSR